MLERTPSMNRCLQYACLLGALLIFNSPPQHILNTYTTTILVLTHQLSQQAHQTIDKPLPSHSLEAFKLTAILFLECLSQLQVTVVRAFAEDLNGLGACCTDCWSTRPDSNRGQA